MPAAIGTPGPPARWTDGLPALFLLAAYDQNGRFVRMYALSADLPDGSSFQLGALIDNADGRVASLRAFAWASLDAPIPLGASTELK